MTAKEVNRKLARPPIGKPAIKKLKFSPMQLQVPSDRTFSHGVVDSVTQQATGIDAVWDNKENALTLRISFGGPGLWIPYLGNGAAEAKGVAQTVAFGLGTYTPPLVGGGVVSWVVTGPFTGCTAATFSPSASKVFAHIITPAPAHPCDTVPNQIANIAAKVGAPVPTGNAVIRPMLAGEVFVFWMYLGSGWYRRLLWAVQGAGCMTVLGVEKKVQV
jgi:hypothetical protein